MTSFSLPHSALHVENMFFAATDWNLFIGLHRHCTNASNCKIKIPNAIKVKKLGRLKEEQEIFYKHFVAFHNVHAVGPNMLKVFLEAHYYFFFYNFSFNGG